MNAPLRIPFINMKISKSPSIGIKILTILPIPLFIPAEIIETVRIINIECQTKRFSGEEITFPN
tara:strand:+ start:797 stop:988 length:192 start_codon:yes stop_codon:yes gene_type:complete